MPLRYVSLQTQIPNNNMVVSSISPHLSGIRRALNRSPFKSQQMNSSWAFGRCECIL